MVYTFQPKRPIDESHLLAIFLAMVICRLGTRQGQCKTDCWASINSKTMALGKVSISHIRELPRQAPVEVSDTSWLVSKARLVRKACLTVSLLSHLATT